MKELPKWISISDRYNKMYLDSKFKYLGFNTTQHMLIKKICEREGMLQEDLFSYVYLNKSNITRGLKQLEEKGFIYRVKDENDKRNMRLFPTELSKEVYPKIIEIINNWVEILEEGLTEEECSVLEKAIKHVGQNAIKGLLGKENNLDKNLK